MSKAVRVSDGLVMCDLNHIRLVAALCLFFKIRCNSNQAVQVALHRVRVLAYRNYHLVVYVQSRNLDVPKSRTVQFSRTPANIYILIRFLINIRQIQYINK